VFIFVEHSNILNDMNADRPQQIINKALARLRELVPGLRADLLQTPDGGDQPGGHLELARPPGRPLAPLAVAVRPRVTAANLPGLIGEFAGRPRLLITDYLAPDNANHLRKNNIFYLDRAGNAYIDIPGMLVAIAGQKLPARARARPPAAFGDAAVRLVFALLMQPELLGRPYREMAEVAGVAQGTITYVLKNLEALGYCQKPGQRRILRRRLALAERWADAYAERLRPKQLRGRFDVPGPDWWKDVPLDTLPAAWGGEPAGALLTKYLRAERYTLYLTGQPADHATLNRFIARHGLRKNPEGDLEVLDAFWRPDLVGLTELGTVPPLIAYADLMATGEARCMDAGRRIYDDCLADYFRD